MSRNSGFIITKVNRTQRFLKTQAELNGLPSDFEDVYLKSKFEIYLQRNASLYELTYPMYFQWWHKSMYGEQCKAEKGKGKGNSTLNIGFKGVNEFVELKQCVKDRIAALKILKDSLDNIGDKLKDQYKLQKAALFVIKDTYKHSCIIIREVTDQLFGNVEEDNLLPPQNKSLDEYLKNFTDSQS